MRCATPLFVCSFTLQSVVLSAALCTNSAEAALVGNYVVGSGANASFIQFQFTNENTYLYEVRYNGSMTGRALFDVVAAAQPGFFSFTYDSFSFGDFVTGITIGADTMRGQSLSLDSRIASSRTARGTDGLSTQRVHRTRCQRRAHSRFSRADFSQRVVDVEQPTHQVMQQTKQASHNAGPVSVSTL